MEVALTVKPGEKVTYKYDMLSTDKFDCDLCNKSGKIELEGKEWPCPKCKGRGFYYHYEMVEQEVQATVYNIQYRLTPYGIQEMVTLLIDIGKRYDSITVPIQDIVKLTDNSEDIKVKFKFEPGQEVFLFYDDIEYKYSDCEMCKTTGKVVIDSEEYECPVCDGLGRKGEHKAVRKKKKVSIKACVYDYKTEPKYIIEDDGLERLVTEEFLALT